MASPRTSLAANCGNVHPLAPQLSEDCNNIMEPGLLPPSAGKYGLEVQQDGTKPRRHLVKVLQDLESSRSRFKVSHQSWSRSGWMSSRSRKISK
jgi:hypothetical protein